MRVIKAGTPEKEMQCPNCNSVLAYTSEDIMQDIVPIHGEWYLREYIVCPVCRVKLALSHKNEYEVMLNHR